jgi:two-component system sensor kinase FixL
VGKAHQSAGPTVLHDLQIADARWRAVLGTARDAIISIDARGRITLFNPAAEHVFGYRADEVLGENVRLLMPSPYREEHDDHIRRYQETGDARAIGRIRSVHARRKNGEVFPIELSVSESRIGDEVLYTAIIRDVGERLATEQALRTQRGFSERLIETAQMIILVLDGSRRIVRYNAYMEQVSGRRLADVRGADYLATFIPERERPRVSALLVAAQRTGAMYNQITPLVVADGTERQIEWSSNVLTDSDGKPSGLLCTGHDMTERLAERSELRELQRLAHERARLADIGAITAKIVHDLGNPLAALSMQAQLILRRARRGDFMPVDKVQKPAEQILSTLRRLEELVHEFNDFAREQRLEIRPINVGAFLASCVDLWKALATERGITLELRELPPLPVLRADDVMLRRVLDNLIKNAIEAVDTGSGTVVLVAADIPSADKIRVSVEDSGHGVQEGLDVFRLFETTKPSGTGIGLAVAKQIVVAHGGVIGHRARSPAGTIFFIELPVHGPTKRDA